MSVIGPVSPRTSTRRTDESPPTATACAAGMLSLMTCAIQSGAGTPAGFQLPAACQLPPGCVLTHSWVTTDSPAAAPSSACATRVGWMSSQKTYWSGFGAGVLPTSAGAVVFVNPYADGFVSISRNRPSTSSWKISTFSDDSSCSSRGASRSLNCALRASIAASSLVPRKRGSCPSGGRLGTRNCRAPALASALTWLAMLLTGVCGVVCPSMKSLPPPQMTNSSDGAGAAPPPRYVLICEPMLGNEKGKNELEPGPVFVPPNA